MKNKKINLYYYLEHNFWRSNTHYRIDELWYIGWFGRLFRNMLDLKINTKPNEHCGGVPNNILGAPIWYVSDNTPNGMKSTIRVKHYGYADWNRVTKRYNMLMERDFDVSLQERHLRYDRMINETGMVLMPWGNTWTAYPYCKTDIEKKAFSETMPEPPEIIEPLKEHLNILIICFGHDPAGVMWLLTDNINKHTKHKAECIVRQRVPLTERSAGYIYFTDLSEAMLQKKIKNADIIHFVQNHPLQENVMTDIPTRFPNINWIDILKEKPCILHNHGGAVLLDTEKYIGDMAKYDIPILLCTPLNIPLFHTAKWLPNIIPINDPLYKPTERNWSENIKIEHKIFYLHGDYVKGTKMLLEVINTFLRDTFKYPVEMIWYHDLVLDECLRKSSECHMCIGTLTEGFAGMTIWESLSKGQVCLCRLDPTVYEAYTKLGDGTPPPILNPSGMDEMSKMIINLCKNRNQLKKLAIESRNWMEKHYNPEKLINLYIDYYKTIIKRKKNKRAALKCWKE